MKKIKQIFFGGWESDFENEKESPKRYEPPKKWWKFFT